MYLFYKDVLSFLGIGYATAVIVFLLNCEYNIILSWTFYYIFASFTSILPWSHCNNDWNTENCTTFEDLQRLHGNYTSDNTKPSVLANYLQDSNISEWYEFLNSSDILGSDLDKNNTPVTWNSTRNLSTARNLYPDPVTEFWE